MSPPRHFLFLVASTRERGHLGNTEWLAQQAAAALPPTDSQHWVHLAELQVPSFVDQRHTVGTYPAPAGDLGALLQATLASTDIVLVAPVYWYSFPASLKACLDHWSAWLRVPGLGFKEAMQTKTLRLITTNGGREKAQPMIDSAKMCADFFPMRWGGVLWGKGGPPDAVKADTDAVAAASGFLR